ncbi:hypothetical protein [Amycolatopsis sp. FDAARGOS 1241]|uniref:hypothetical protein n=1 Tax=Amycolatopsis sp. FDAARGOS 1241 TaxID=2778070 RepID=UPI00194F4938|nr:hypothetical protein [Amycolatopsis sp. FDAARGOS 1241]QRP47988.1 hypothetical protein I6J71_08925 [Amycolatopsis sp. FDAARGOS 1241]
MADEITGYVRIQLADLGAFQPRNGLTVEIDLGDGWPDLDAELRVRRVAYWADRVVLVGADPHAVACIVKNTNQYLSEQRAAEAQHAGGVGA